MPSNLVKLRDLTKDVKLADRIANYIRLILLLDTETFLLDTKRTRIENLKWNAWKFGLLLFQYLSCIRLIGIDIVMKIYGLQAGDWLGDHTRYYGGVVTTYMWGSLFFTSLGMTFCNLTLRFQRNEFNWPIIRKNLSPINVIARRCPAEDIGLNVDEADFLRKRAALCYYLSSNAVLLFSGMFWILSAYLLITFVNLMQYWPACLISWVMFNFWILLNITSLCTSVVYFHLLCLVIKMRCDRFKLYLKLNYHVKGFRSRLILIKIHKEQISILNMLETFNRYWSNYVYCCHQSSLPLVALTLYFAVVAGGELLSRSTFFVVFIECFSTFTFTCLSAAKISKEVRIDCNILIS